MQDYRRGLRVAPGKEPKDTPEVQIVNSPNSVVSVGQSGGQTAQKIINKRPISRVLSTEAKTIIQSQLRNFSPTPFKILLSNGDAEIDEFAHSLKSLLEEIGWENTGFIYNLAGHYPKGLEIAIGNNVTPLCRH